PSPSPSSSPPPTARHPAGRRRLTRQLFVSVVLIGAAGVACGESSLMTKVDAVTMRIARASTPCARASAQAAGAQPEVPGSCRLELATPNLPAALCPQ